MDKTRITVLIPTYNRKEKLAATLKALYEQDNKDFNVVISDNCSDYSIEEELLSEFPKEFIDRVIVHHQRFNIGAAANIVGLLSLCNTEYGWMLGDDDHVQPKAINNICAAINKYPNVNFFWFLLGEESGEKLIDNMDELNDFLCELNNRGDFIFCSNKVYKISALAKYMSSVYRFIYTQIPQCFPLIESLKERKSIGIVGGESLVIHGGFPGGVTWNINKVVLGLITLMDYPTDLTWEKHCRFVKNVMFSPSDVFYWYFKDDDLPWNYKSYLKRVYYGCYHYCYPIHKRLVIKIAYWVASCPVGWRLLKILKDSVEKLNHIRKGTHK